MDKAWGTAPVAPCDVLALVLHHSRQRAARTPRKAPHRTRALPACPRHARSGRSSRTHRGPRVMGQRYDPGSMPRPFGTTPPEIEHTTAGDLTAAGSHPTVRALPRSVVSLRVQPTPIPLVSFPRTTPLGRHPQAGWHDAAPLSLSTPPSSAVVPRIHTRFQATRIPQSKTAIRESAAPLYPFLTLNPDIPRRNS